ncbi:MAG: 30S ribosomal protein S17e [Candidatus Woesearchaeota archaeon]
MGRIKTRMVKSVTKDLYEKHSEEIKTDFDENKKLVDVRLDVYSKKLRNIISGYATRLKKSDK